MDTNVFIHLQFMRQIFSPLPGVTEKMCFGTPAFYVNKYLLSRMKEDGETITVQTFERDKWMQADPETFFITEHYRNYDCMLINLNTVSAEDLTTLLHTAWHNRALKKLLKQYLDSLQKND